MDKSVKKLTNPIEKPPKWWTVLYEDRIICDDDLTDELVDRMAEDLMTWATQPDSLKISQFFLARRIPERTFYRIIKRTEKSRYAIDYALTCLGNRREICAALGELEQAIIRPSMVIYDNAWKEMEVWRSNLKQQDTQPKGIAEHVVLQIGPESIVLKEADGTNQD